jgi:hypothetical protein
MKNLKPTLVFIFFQSTTALWIRAQWQSLLQDSNFVELENLLKKDFGMLLKTRVFN